MSLPASTLYVDANIIIYIMEGHPTQIRSLELLVDALDDASLACVTSELTLAEVLVKPFASPDLRYRHEYEEFLSDKLGLSVIPVSRIVLERSAELRAVHGGKLADSIHVATADLLGCSHFLSEDNRIKLPCNLAPLTLSMLPLLLQPKQPSL